MDADAKETILVTILVAILLMNVVAIPVALTSHNDSVRQGNNGCVYESIASLIPGHILGCELVRKRFSY